jgi:hypothetical protein
MLNDLKSGVRDILFRLNYNRRRSQKQLCLDKGHTGIVPLFEYKEKVMLIPTRSFFQISGRESSGPKSCNSKYMVQAITQKWAIGLLESVRSTAFPTLLRSNSDPVEAIQSN